MRSHTRVSQQGCFHMSFFGGGTILCCEGLPCSVQGTQSPWAVHPKSQEWLLVTVTVQISLPWLSISKH